MDRDAEECKDVSEQEKPPRQGRHLAVTLCTGCSIKQHAQVVSLLPIALPGEWGEGLVCLTSELKTDSRASGSAPSSSSAPGTSSGADDEEGIYDSLMRMAGSFSTTVSVYLSGIAGSWAAASDARDKGTPTPRPPSLAALSVPLEAESAGAEDEDEFDLHLLQGPLSPLSPPTIKKRD